MFNDYNTYGSNTWMIISMVTAVIGGICLYFTFLSKDNDGKFKNFLGKLYDFLTFKKMWIEGILKITYLILAIYVTLSSFALIGVDFFSFIVSIAIGNLTLRIFYEFSLVLLTICRNTTEINSKMKK